MKIYKYPVLTDNANQTEFKIRMPKDAKILSFQTKDNEPYIWASFDPSKGSDNTTERSFRLIGTGIDFDSNESDRYISTVQNGPFVWHLYQTGA